MCLFCCCCCVCLEPLGKGLLLICAWRRAWLRHHPPLLVSSFMHMISVSLSETQTKSLKAQQAFSFFNFNCFMTITNVLYICYSIVSVLPLTNPTSFLVTDFLFLTLMWTTLSKGHVTLWSNMWGCGVVSGTV